MEYKEPKVFKGFEVWFHALQMTIKMHFFIILIILLLQFAFVTFLWILIKPQGLSLVLKALTSLSYPIMMKGVNYFFKKSLHFFALAQLFWLLYPILLFKFKKKSELIMQDKHLRGSKLMDPEELRKKLIEQIKLEYHQKAKHL